MQDTCKYVFTLLFFLLITLYNAEHPIGLVIMRNYGTVICLSCGKCFY